MLVSSVEAQSERLLACLPRWDHIATNKSYNGALAKKQLLGHPLRGKFGDLIGALGVSKEALDTVLEAWGGHSDQSAIESIETSLDTASLTASVIASVNDIEEFGTKPQGRDMAKTVLAKTGGLPDALKKKLQSVAGTD